MMLTWKQNIQNNNLWFGKIYKPGNVVLVTLQEPLVEKANSFKALASVNAVSINNQWHSTKGNILLYFKKDGTIPEFALWLTNCFQKIFAGNNKQRKPCGT